MADDKPFPFQVTPQGREDVLMVLSNGTEVLLCAHGASVLGAMLTEAAKGQLCDGYRHGDLSTMHIGTREKGPAIVYTTERVKTSTELRPSDVPRGMDPDDFTPSELG